MGSPRSPKRRRRRSTEQGSDGLNPGALDQELAGVSAAINELFEVIRGVKGYQSDKEKLAGAQS